MALSRFTVRNEGAFVLSQEQPTNAYAYTEIATLHDLEWVAQENMMSGLDNIALVTISLQFAHGESGVVSARYFLEGIRALVRRTDHVFLVGTTFYFMLPGANQEGAAIVEERLWEALLWRVHNCDRRDIEHPTCMKSGRGAIKVRSTLAHYDLWRVLCAAVEEQRYFQFDLSQVYPEPHMMIANDEELAQRARQLGIPYLPLLPRTLPSNVRRLIDPQLARELHCCPIGRERNVLTVAMADPQDEVALRRLRQATGLTIYPVLTSMHELQLVW